MLQDIEAFLINDDGLVGPTSAGPPVRFRNGGQHIVNVFDVAKATETLDVVLADAVLLPNHPIYRINIIVDTETREVVEPVSGPDSCHGIKRRGSVDRQTLRETAPTAVRPTVQAKWLRIYLINGAKQEAIYR